MKTRTSAGAPAVAVRDRRITVTGGVRLHYRDWGNPAYPVLVLLHGRGLTARAYDSLARGLADRYRVIVPDLRGHGLPWEQPDRLLTEVRAFVNPSSDVASP